jgi:phospholipid-binding lipoprotein MlaA
MPARRKVLVAILTMWFLIVSFPTLQMARHNMAWRLSPDVARAQVEALQAIQAESEDFEEEKMADPFEPINRAFFQFNDKLYFWVLKPIGKVIRTFVPEGIRIGVHNAFYNTEAPLRVLTNLLQGKFKEGGTEVLSFAINSTIGLGGFFKPAQKEFHLGEYPEDVGQTLGFYGIGPGFYLVLPVLGPSSLRDGVGKVGNFYLIPYYYFSPGYLVDYGLYTFKEVNFISLHIGEYENFKKAAIDPYISMRSAFYQYRVNAIRR